MGIILFIYFSFKFVWNTISRGESSVVKHIILVCFDLIEILYKQPLITSFDDDN